MIWMTIRMVAGRVAGKDAPSQLKPSIRTITSQNCRFQTFSVYSIVYEIYKNFFQSYRAQRIIVHPEYNFTTDLNDIAVVKLSGFARQWDRIRPICLPPSMPESIRTEKQWESHEGGFPKVGNHCVATGWGVTRGDFCLAHRSSYT